MKYFQHKKPSFSVSLEIRKGFKQKQGDSLLV